MDKNAATQDALNRRLFLKHGSTAIGATALATLMKSGSGAQAAPEFGLPQFPNHAPAAKRIIYLFQSGAPSQMTCLIRSRCWRNGAGRICRRRFDRDSD